MRHFEVLIECELYNIYLFIKHSIIAYKKNLFA